MEADQTSKIYVRFGLNADGSSTNANQVFVRFGDLSTNNEIIFVAEKSGDAYSCEVDLATHAKSFGHKSGAYLMQLFVSDPLISNSITLDLANINLKFIEQQSKASSKAQFYAPKPEIKHMFRVAEPRPSTLVSNVFAVLCLLPTVLLIVLVSHLYEDHEAITKTPFILF